MLTALVVDADATARDEVADLLCLGGWDVQQAAGPEDAVRHALVTDVDLVVTDAELPGGSGTGMLRRIRRNGSSARFVVVTADPTDEVRAEAAAAGALTTLAKPVTARALLDFLRRRTTGPAEQARSDDTDVPDDADLVDAELMTRLRGIYADALPARLSAIDRHTRTGDATAVAFAAHTLAGTSGQLGHPEVASICREIAADARRGVLAHSRVVQLHELAGA
ncbi:response regulator [Blastococcus xanthinilyticus]|uniref:Hpt domain-containing protein n=1 Tax=Blastococcus xanthinilyticus TaxID=1564164 RepID=A0A5S5CM84_9ACTN|nr:response regulator [Blastococcus xanthinilyticus]TYP82794.1 Hpt domain-containing protein [Blastococcus xanthinilyticus]